MAEYIERIKALQAINEFYHDPKIDIVIRNIPKANVVEVVRCCDCKYQDECARQMVHTTRDYVLEQNISTYNKVDFCSYGERKED